jgi:deazaflavin-dependent oxidoreductase (nitroreductase family)
MDSESVRKGMRLINKYFMVPAYRMGLGGLISSPLAGYIMVIKTVGRKSGRVRYSPVNYAILDGSLYCLAGFGAKSDWYLNIQAANAEVEIILPGSAIRGAAEEVTDEGERLFAARALLKNAGFAGFFAGFNPFTASDEEIQQKLQGYPLLRIRPVGIGSSPSDPGGWMWIPVFVLSAWWGMGLLRKKKR